MASTWTVAQVIAWLHTLGLENAAHVIEVFQKQSIGGDALLTLTDGDLKDELGIKEFGIRRKISAAITELKANTGSAPPPAALPQPAPPPAVPPVPDLQVYVDVAAPQQVPVIWKVPSLRIRKTLCAFVHYPRTPHWQS
eukprot:TRINITY_DN12952_c0_g1_i7.p1 TRINITY_DN12952_c0_g1~~TRINITY_DN12952_c0_g1_i7.p1  ORF type:complete len:146 (+),score=19.86 TRINITY_DN12952_c0_g1_i7:22-438(+)